MTLEDIKNDSEVNILIDSTEKQLTALRVHRAWKKTCWNCF